MSARVKTEPPPVAPVPPGVDRPFWSVMVPAYNASELLEKGLRCVLDQDPGPDRMQIAVVDDCSTNGVAERTVARLAPGRVEYHRQPSNVGLAGNWNGAIARARGRWLHLLHQDDLISQGFYEALGRADAECPSAGAAFCRHAHVDGDGHWLYISDLERRDAGRLEDWLPKISQGQHVQCASVVVRRDVYERLGGFRGDLLFALDWEMWARISSHYDVWYEPSFLACWRVYKGNESSRIYRERLAVPDVLKAVGLIRTAVPADLRPSVGSRLLAELAGVSVLEAQRLMQAGDRRGGMLMIRQATECVPALAHSRVAWNYQKWALKLWLRERLGLRPAVPDPAH